METTKTILAMVGLVLIGFLAGFFLQRQMTKHHFKKVKKMRTTQGLKEELFDAIHADEQQRTLLLPKIQPCIEGLNQVHQTFKEERTEWIDSLKKVLAPELSEKQKNELDGFTKRLIKLSRKKNYTQGKKEKKNLSNE